MTLLEVNYTATLGDQFIQNGRKRHKYKFIDCTKAVQGLEILGNTEWAEFMQRVVFHARTMKIDVLATSVEFNKAETEEILGKKGIVVHLD